jgi:hypothetical protein
MPSLNQIKLHLPSDWQEFQRMTCDLYKKIWKNDYIQEFGSIGQRQNGVDVYGFPNEGKIIEGIQCKCVDKLTQTDVKKEYEKSLGFQPKLSRFIIVTTSKKDKNIQQKAAEITCQNEYPCEVVFWKDYCQLLSDYPEVLEKYYSDFIILKTVYDSPGKLIKIDIDVNHYEVLVSRIKSDDSHYGGTILISDLMNKRCITYRLGDHWSRLEGIVGITKCDAFLISKWLNNFKNIESLLRLGKTTIIYQLSKNDKKEAIEMGFMLMSKNEK